MFLVALCISNHYSVVVVVHLVPFTTDPESFEDDKWNRAAFETYCTRYYYTRTATTTHIYNDIYIETHIPFISGGDKLK